MEFMYIHTNASNLNQIIQKDSALGIIHTQPNMTFLKDILQCYMSGETIFTPLLVMTKYLPRTVIPRSSSSGTNTHMDMKISIT